MVVSATFNCIKCVSCSVVKYPSWGFLAFSHNPPSLFVKYAGFLALLHSPLTTLVSWDLAPLKCYLFAYIWIYMYMYIYRNFAKSYNYVIHDLHRLSWLKGNKAYCRCWLPCLSLRHVWNLNCDNLQCVLWSWIFWIFFGI